MTDRRSSTGIGRILDPTTRSIERHCNFPGTRPHHKPPHNHSQVINPDGPPSTTAEHTGDK
eukprot:5102714-Pyramimonas_sp.AAC.1